MAKPKYIGVPESFMDEVDIQDMMENNHTKYLMINLLALRSRDLNEGARAFSEVEGPHTPLDVAIKEAREGKIKGVRMEKGESPADNAPNE